VHGWHEELVEPFLHDSLAVAASNAYYRYVKLIAVSLCESLQCGKGIVDDEKVGIVESWLRCVNDKVAHTAVVEFLDVSVAIIARGAKGKEQRFFRK
jgi:hypothetical protein